MNLEEIKALATSVIESGYADNMNEDDIKMEMFTQKVPYSKLNSLFKSISIELGLMVNPKDVTDGINKLVIETDWEPLTEWSQIADQLDNIVDRVDGASVARALTLVRSHCRDEEIELPAKPRASSGGGSRGGKVAVAVADLFAEGFPTKEEFFNTVLPLVKGPKNAEAYVNYFFVLCSATKAGTSYAEALNGTKDQKVPSWDEADIDDEDDFEDAA